MLCKSVILKSLFYILLLLVVSCSGDESLSSTPVVSTPTPPQTTPDIILPDPFVDDYALFLAPDKLPDPILPTYSSEQWEQAVEASRFLAQSSFGATAKNIDFILKNGKEAWLEQQFSQEQSLQLKLLDRRLDHFGYIPEPPFPYYDDQDGKQGSWHRFIMRSDIWWETAVWGQDQLRQRVAFALSQILVVSQIAAGQYARERGFANYHDLLAKHAFGNYRDLLIDVSLNPIMGIYLSAVNNQKAKESLRIRPDENYAREILQLFSIGLNELNADGSLIIDINGKTISTYNLDTVKEFARVFTGWSMASTTFFGEGQSGGLLTHPSSDVQPMKAYPDFHDGNAKTLLNNEVIPSGNSPREDIEAAIDNIMAHKNVAPFIGKKLIQYLITSNPSPEYIARVSAVFNDNGAGIKGDMKAVIRAIYLDDDARNPPHESIDYYGKLKEWPIQAASVWRAFKAQGVRIYFGKHEIETIRYMNGELYEEQHAFTAPSVFNFYQSEYSPPGDLGQKKLLAPEFQEFTDSNAVRQANLLSTMIYNRDLNDKNFWKGAEGQAWGVETGWHNPPIHAKLNLVSEISIASNARALVDRLNLLLANGQLSNDDSQLIAEHINLLNDPREKIYEAAFLIAVSPEFAIQR